MALLRQKMSTQTVVEPLLSAACVGFAAAFGRAYAGNPPDRAPSDRAPTGTLKLAPTTVGGLLINGEVLNASTGPDLFSNSVLSVINTTNQTLNVDIVLSDRDFVAPISQFQAAAPKHVAERHWRDEGEQLVY
jgi:hypothetical protein